MILNTGKGNSKAFRIAENWPLALLSFTALSLAVSLLFALYFVPQSRINEAKTWSEIPCEVESIRQAGEGLDIVYRYEYGGVSYKGGRYDLTVGHSGEDDWARDAVVRYTEDTMRIAPGVGGLLVLKCLLLQGSFS